MCATATTTPSSDDTTAPIRRTPSPQTTVAAPHRSSLEPEPARRRRRARVYGDVAVAVNLDQRLSSPLFNLARPRPAGRREPARPASSVNGGTVEVSRPGAGRALPQPERRGRPRPSKAGDSDHAVHRQDTQQDFNVKAIVEDKRLAGAGRHLDRAAKAAWCR